MKGRRAVITSKSMPLAELFTEISYEIDFYQRDYTWGQEEVRTLVRDLCDTFLGGHNGLDVRHRPNLAPQYFLGPFVHHDEDGGRRFLVDGQQRFVTLHLIFIHLRSLVRGLSAEDSVDRLNRVIRRHSKRFTIAIPDHEPVLQAIAAGREYEPRQGDSLSRQNLWARSREIESALRGALEAEDYPSFVDWLLDRVVLVGIRAVDRDHAYRMFESMNDRGARLTPVDLLKSHLLANVRADEERLNARWREMLSELAIYRDDTMAPSRFIKAVLLARYARLESSEDRSEIELNPNLWVRRNERGYLNLYGRPDRYFSFVEELIKLAKLYRPWLAASHKYDKRLEAIYFNEKNGLTPQMVAILAAVQPDDTPSEANEKACRIASFLDRWHALNIMQDLPVQRRDVEELVYDDLLPALRACRGPAEVTAALGRLVAKEEVSFRDCRLFGLRGNNRNQVGHVLARLTAYMEEELGQPHDVVAYLDSALYQVEHLWPKHHDHVQDDIADPVVFRTLRNQLGGLGLLPRSHNAALNDMPFRTKTELYRGRAPAALAILSPGYDVRNKKLRDFINKHGLTDTLRRFGRNDSMSHIIETRQRMYLALCEVVWDPVKLEIIEPDAATALERDGSGDASVASRPTRDGTARHKARRRTDVARMLNAGVLSSGTRIVFTHGGKDYWANVDADGGIVLESTGVTYDKADDAGAAIRDRKTCRGMDEWHVEQSGERVSLRSVRDHAEATGRLGRRRR